MQKTGENGSEYFIKKKILNYIELLYSFIETEEIKVVFEKNHSSGGNGEPTER